MRVSGPRKSKKKMGTAWRSLRRACSKLTHAGARVNTPDGALVYAPVPRAHETDHDDLASVLA